MRWQSHHTTVRYVLPLCAALVLTLLAITAARSAETINAFGSAPICPKGFLADLLAPKVVRAQQELDSLAIAYGTGHCQPVNGVEAERELQAAARKNHPVALFILGLSHATGNGYPRDITRANTLYERAANLGNALAQHYLGLNLLRFAKSQKEGLSRLRQAAGNGYAVSAMLLGQIYELGRFNLTKEPCLARDWYETARVNGLDAGELRAHRLEQTHRCTQLARR